MFVYQTTGMPLDTKRLASTDTAATLPTVYMGATATRITETGFSRAADQCVITCDVNSIRYTQNGVTPTVGAAAVGHVLGVGDPLILTSQEQIAGLKIISKTTGVHATLQVTPYIIGSR